MIFFVAITAAGTFAALFNLAIGHWDRALAGLLVTFVTVGVGLFSVWHDQRMRRRDQLDDRVRRLLP